ncbi:MAG TPA: DUF3999 family protein [Pyrinomonadaceae bacterium]|nr:DUF3999 family protein [Pyrinomonadaceae bacterium]
MRRFVYTVLIILSLSASAVLISTRAQTATTAWPFIVEIQPAPTAPGLYDLTVPLHVMDRSRSDLSDLRLFDAQGKEIPYAIRIRRDIDQRRAVDGNLFNQASTGEWNEVSVDLGESPLNHNEVEVDTYGSNFRRRVEVDGSDNGTDWKKLQNNALVFSFESQNKIAQSNRVSYPVSRYRFLRVRVFGDDLVDKEAPGIRSVKAVNVVKGEGELSTWNVNVPSYQLFRYEGAPSSAWNIDLGAYVPVDRLILNVEQTSFSRPFYLEAVDDLQNLRLVASGELTRRTGEEIKPIVIKLDQEEHARKLRLVVNDHSNHPLMLDSISVGAPTRQLVFELKETPALPLRLFYGNPKAEAPHYDFENELPAKLANRPVRIEVGPATQNPGYEPEPLPFTERVSWLIYIVLAISSLALALILWKLAHARIKTNPPETNHEGEAVRGA